MSNYNEADDYALDDEMPADWQPPAETALARIEPNKPMILTQEERDILIAPVQTPEIVKAKREMVYEFIKAVAVPGISYGNIPGTAGNSMLKELNDQIVAYYGFRLDPTCVDSTVDRDFVSYRYKSRLYKDGILLGEAERVASSDEPCFCQWINWTPPADEDQRQYLLSYKLAQWGGSNKDVWQQKMPNPQPRSIAFRIAARAQKRANVLVVKSTLAIDEILNRFPVVPIIDARERAAGAKPQQSDRRQITQGEAQQGQQQAGRIVEASPKTFYNLIATKGWTKDAPEVKRISGPAYGNKITWEEAIQRAQQLPQA